MTSSKPKTKPSGKKAEPLTPAEQRRRFEELSRELGTDGGETLDRVFGKIVPAKVAQEEAGAGSAEPEHGKIKPR